MLHVHQDVDTHSFQVKDDTENIVAEGFYGVDAPDHSALVLVTKTAIMSNDYSQIDQLLSTIELHFGKPNHARVFTRLAMFDQQRFDIGQLHVNWKRDCLMVTDAMHLKIDQLIPFDRDQLELITEKETIETYSQSIITLMRQDAFWAKEWTEQNIKDKLHSASGVVLIIDRITKLACAFGRIVIVRSAAHQGEKFAYITDITVASHRQNQGLGFTVSKTLLQMFLHGADQSTMQGTVCLFCSDQGTGAIAAPKLYRKCGFEFCNLVDNHLVLIHTDQFHPRTSS